MALSVFAHGCIVLVVAVVAVYTSWTTPKRIIDPDTTIQVSIVSLPKSEKAIPDKASRAPVPQGRQPQADRPPPPVPSEMTMHSPDVEPTAGSPDVEADLDRMMRELEMERMLDDLAPIGSENRRATSPDGTNEDGFESSGSGIAGDPEWERYKRQIQAIFDENFDPLKAVVRANPNLVAVLHVAIDATGRVTGHRVLEPSGNPSYDRAAEAAAEAVTKLPLPPEKFRARTADGFTVVFEAPPL